MISSIFSRPKVFSVMIRSCPALPWRPSPYCDTSNGSHAPIWMVLGPAAILALLPEPASAHIKWFAPYDVATVPVAVRNVLSPHFVLVFMSFMAMIFGGFLLDRLVAARLRGPASGAANKVMAETLLRAGCGGFFMALFATGGVILTPELRTDADWPAWLQLGIAISLLSGRTCLLGAIGILALYGYGIALYGAFHLLDYPMFVGIAAYLALTSSTSDRLRSLRMPILSVSICVGLMWGAVEKWAYPEWTIPLLQARPYLTLGVAPADVLIIAGFVEFSLAFYILTGLTLVRPAILALVFVFSAAVLDFGKVDAIGHLPIVMPLLAMLAHGPNQVNRWFYDASAGLVAEARKATTAFATSICLLCSFYYAVQSAEEGGKATHVARIAAANPTGLSVRVGSPANSGALFSRTSSSVQICDLNGIRALPKEPPSRMSRPSQTTAALTSCRSVITPSRMEGCTGTVIIAVGHARALRTELRTCVG